MNIKETNLKFKGMEVRSKTVRAILHHASAKTCSAEDIHRWHLDRGWSGAGYHFLVRKDGSVYRLRPEKYVGAHASGNNSDSIGICFEGDFETEKMGDKQKNFPFSEIAETSGSVTVTEEKEGSGDLKVDGWWGVKTTRLLQKIFGTPVDGIVSNQDPDQKRYLLRADSGSWDFKGQGNGSDLIGAMQKKVGVKDDGFMGPKTIKAWQKYLGVSVDGKMGEKTVKAIQKWANEQA